MSIPSSSGWPAPQRAGDGAAVSGLRVVLAEDDVLLREGLASLLQRSGLQVVGQAGDGERLLALVEVEHAMELLASGRGIGYLLKSRVTDVAEFLQTLDRVARGGSVVDPALVAELVTARRRNDPLAALSAREHEVLALMAEGRSNAGIARRLWVTEGTVEKHVRSILAKLTLPEADDDHRRVLAVLTFLEAR